MQNDWSSIIFIQRRRDAPLYIFIRVNNEDKLKCVAISDMSNCHGMIKARKGQVCPDCLSLHSCSIISVYMYIGWEAQLELYQSETFLLKKGRTENPQKGDRVFVRTERNGHYGNNRDSHLYSFFEGRLHTLNFRIARIKVSTFQSKPQMIRLYLNYM